MDHWEELDDEGWSTASGLADKTRRLGGVPEVSVALGEASGVCGGLCRLWRSVSAHRMTCLSSLRLPFFGRKPYDSLHVTASCLVLALLASSSGDHVTCASLPKVPSLFCNNLLFLLWAWELLLPWAVGAVCEGPKGTGQGQALLRKRMASISGWEKPYGGWWQGTLEVELGGLSQCVAQMPDLLSLFLQSRDSVVLSSQLP